MVYDSHKLASQKAPKGIKLLLTHCLYTFNGVCMKEMTVLGRYMCQGNRSYVDLKISQSVKQLQIYNN